MTFIALVTIVIALALAGLDIKNYFVIQQLRGELAAHTGTKLLARTDDDDVVALLEAQAQTSALASRLLEVARSEPCKLLPTPAFQHNPDVDTPHEERWRLLWQQYEVETTDSARALFIRRVVGNARFTEYEKTQLLEQITDVGLRDDARSVLYPKRNEATIPFRWSKQPLTMICTMTCECGEPARACDGVGLVLQCVKGHRTSTSVQPTAEMIFIDPDGSAWRCIDNKWFKAAID